MKLFHSLPLYHRFLIVPLLGAALLLVPLVHGWLDMRSLERRLARMEQGYLEDARQLRLLMARQEMLHQALVAPSHDKPPGEGTSLPPVSTTIPAELEEALARLAAKLKEVETAAPLLAGSPVPELLARYRSQVRGLTQGPESDRVASLLALERIHGALVPYFAAVTDRLQRQVGTGLRQARAKLVDDRRGLAAAFVVTFVAMGLFALVLARLLSRDLAAAARAMRRLAAGERRMVLPASDGSPEMAGLVEGLRAFRQALERLDGRALQLHILNREMKQEIRERRRLEEALRLTSAVFEHSLEGIMITDLEGHILRVNRAFTRITGWRQEEVLGRTPRVLRSGRHEPAFYREMWRALVEQGAWQGEIWNRRKDGEVYPEWRNISAVVDEKGRVIYYVSIFADISERKAAAERLRRLTYHDPVTGLPNRRRLLDRLEELVEQGRPLAFFHLDLDRFKLVNDALGHEQGDRLLQELAQRLKSTLPEGAYLARTGGDEFGVVLEGPSGVAEATGRAEALLEALGRPLEVGGQPFYLTASLGITFYPDDADNASMLLKNADVAMYRAKARGGNGLQFYERRMQQQASARLDLENGLRRALERGELELHYQPQVEMEHGEVVGVEALVRWRHPERGLVPPDQFIPVAEESGLILEIDRWVAETACVQFGAWLAEGVPLKQISINVSGRELQGQLLQEGLIRTVWREAIPPHFVELEITETFLMGDPARSVAMLDQLREQGFRLAIDDFGTAYSSLSYLKRFPVQRLKIDRSFIRDLPGDPDDAAITQAIIVMAGQLGLEVIAEGVETPEQARFLLAHGCTQAQGYLFARPLPAAELTALLREPPPIVRALGAEEGAARRREMHANEQWGRDVLQGGDHE